jgi:hypothetical protein
MGPPRRGKGECGMSTKETPLQDQQGHVWKEPDKGQTRCVNCGAYRHLGSGIMACPGEPKDQAKSFLRARAATTPFGTSNGLNRLCYTLYDAVAVVMREYAEAETAKLRAAIIKHHAQKADDRCQFDDDELYAAAGLPPADRRVGDKFAMLANCARFIEKRCEGGGPWKSYAELEAENKQLRTAIGVCVPSVLRCFIKQTDSEIDREFATKVLARVEEAMGDKAKKETN